MSRAVAVCEDAGRSLGRDLPVTRRGAGSAGGAVAAESGRLATISVLACRDSSESGTHGGRSVRNGGALRNNSFDRPKYPIRDHAQIHTHMTELTRSLSFLSRRGHDTDARHSTKPRRMTGVSFGWENTFLARSRDPATSVRDRPCRRRGSSMRGLSRANEIYSFRTRRRVASASL